MAMQVPARQETAEMQSRGESQKEEDAKVAKGQRTAVITGFVSVAFGVIYLALTAFLDSRGSQLLPPPPEAFGQ
eukprot:jgi/Astpho2/2083/Aster-x0503